MEDTLYCLVKEDKIVKGPCNPPRSHNGIINFDRQSNHILKEYGWLPVNIPVLGENQKFGNLVVYDSWINQLAIDEK
jgi:hypothetical protein